MAHRLLRDPEQDGWERSDMPIVCETCLGPNPFVRMQRIEYGGLCHISNRPYTVFRWRPGNDARYKKTIICQEVAKAKNVCQVCLLDLDYNLPVQVRDQALGMTNEDEPQSEVGKEYQLHQRVKEGENGTEFLEAKPNDLLMKLQRTQPYYKRNMARVCSFFAKGACTRGAECPYRHEMPTTGELANQNIKDRYYGINDPVANKMMRKAGDMPTLEPPEDQTIMTLFIGGVGPEITEEDLRDYFYAYGELTNVRKVDSKASAFITYSTRPAAEKAAKDLFGKLIIKGQRLRLSWGKPQAAREGPPGAAGPSDGAGASGATGPSGYGGYGGYNAAPADAAPAMYPSMAHDAMGTRIPAPGDAGGGKRGAEGAGDAGGEHDAKRPRGPPVPPVYGAPPPMYGYRGPPPPGWGMPPPGPYGMPPMRGPPPPGGPRPPMGGPPPVAAPPAAAPPAAAPAPAAAPPASS